MSKILSILTGVLCVAVVVFSVVMTVMAAIFMEYGRVIFYMCVVCISLPLAVISVMRLKNPPS